MMKGRQEMREGKVNLPYPLLHLNSYQTNAPLTILVVLDIITITVT